MQTKFVCVLTCAPEAMYNPPEKPDNLAKTKKKQYLCKQFCKIIYPSIKMQVDNSQQIDLAAECVKTLIAQDPDLQNKEVLYDKLNCITNELKSFDALMRGRLDFALIYKVLSERK